MNDRIAYIDALKGLAIILVVWGHIAEKSMGIENMPFNWMYGSFHMPLFIFLSGLFAYKGMDKVSWKYIGHFLQKKAVRILLPFIIVVGGFYSVLLEHSLTAVLTGESSGYWFLPALFYCMVLGLFQRCLAVRSGGKTKELIFFILVWGIASLVWKAKLPVPYWLAALKMFPYFMAGHYFAQYRLLGNGCLKKQWVQTAAILLYIMTMAVSVKTNFHFINLTGLFAIVVLLNLFSTHSEVLPKWLSVVGKYSLEIYVLHWFFLPRMQDWGKYLLGQASFNENLILTAIVCSIVSVFIIAFCMIVAKILKQSLILDYLCFGVKKKNN